MNDIMHKITSKRSRLSFASGILLASTACLCLLFGLSQDGQAQGQSGSDMGDRGRQSQSTGTQTRHAGPLTAGPRGPGNQGGPYTRDDYHDTGNGRQNNDRNGQRNGNNGGGGGGGAAAARPGISGTGVACVAAEAADKLGEFNIDPSMAAIAGNGRAKRQAGKTGPTNMKDLYKLGTSIAPAGTLDFARRLIKDAAKEEATGTADLVKRAGLGGLVPAGTPEADIPQQALAAADKKAKDARPLQQRQGAQSQGAGQSAGAANTAAEIGHEQADSAITYVGSYLRNFTSDAGNKWNQVRDKIFVPIGILLLLPGALITQMRAIMATSNPVLGNVNPLDGIFRSMVAVFLLPCTYLVMNYGIDLANSLTLSIADQYQQIFHSDMYEDAVCAEIKAMPFRLPEENRNTIDMPKSSMGEILVAKAPTPFAKLEAALVAVKIWDPCVGIYIVPPDRADEVVPSAVHAARLMCNTSNCSLVTAWNILCAFQVAFLYYLWCVGPVVAGLWTWPMKQLRDALPNWIEGVITLCFWSLFWNTVVFLMAAFRGVDETGTLIMLALNSLACLSVKYAFDFAGLARGVGQQVQKLGDKFANTMHQEAKKAGKGGGGGGGGGGGKGKKGGSNPSGPAAPAAPAAPTGDPTINANNPGGTAPVIGDDGPTGTTMGPELPRTDIVTGVVPGRTAGENGTRITTTPNENDFDNGVFDSLLRTNTDGTKEDFKSFKQRWEQDPEGDLRGAVQNIYSQRAILGRHQTGESGNGLTGQDRKDYLKLIADGKGGVKGNVDSILQRLGRGEKISAAEERYLSFVETGMRPEQAAEFRKTRGIIQDAGNGYQSRSFEQQQAIDSKVALHRAELMDNTLKPALNSGTYQAYLAGGKSQALSRDTIATALPPSAEQTRNRKSYTDGLLTAGVTPDLINARMAAMDAARAKGESQYWDPIDKKMTTVENFRDALPPGITDPVAIERALRIEAAQNARLATYIDPDPTKGEIATPKRERDTGYDAAIAEQRRLAIEAARRASATMYADPLHGTVPVPPLRNRDIVERTVMVQSPVQQQRIKDAKGRGEEYYQQWLAKERKRLHDEANVLGDSGYEDPADGRWVSLKRNRGGSEFDTAMITAADINPMTGQPIVHRPGEVVQGIQPMLRGEVSRSARKAGDDLDIIATPEGEDIEERLRKQKEKPDDTMLATNDFSQPNQFGRASVEGDPQMIVPAEGIGQPGQAQLRPDQLDAEGRMAEGQPGQPQQIDPETGLPIDPKTGLPIDPRTNLPFNPQTGQYFDPRTGLPIQPNQAYQMGLQAGGGMLLNEQDRARQQQGQQPGQPQPGQPGHPQQGQPGQYGQTGQYGQPGQPGQPADDKTVFVPDHGLTPDISNIKGPDKKKLRNILGDAFGKMNEEDDEEKKDEDEEGKDKDKDQGPDPNIPPPWAQ